MTIDVDPRRASAAAPRSVGTPDRDLTLPAWAAFAAAVLGHLPILGRDLARSVAGWLHGHGDAKVELDDHILYVRKPMDDR